LTDEIRRRIIASFYSRTHQETARHDEPQEDRHAPSRTQDRGKDIPGGEKANGGEEARRRASHAAADYKARYLQDRRGEEAREIGLEESSS
jgi:hypothetical protein